MKKIKKFLTFLMAVSVIVSTWSTNMLVSRAYDGTDSQTDKRTDADEEAELEDNLINYVLVESSEVAIPGTQTILVGIGNGEKNLTGAVLQYKNTVSEESYQVKPSEVLDDGIKFQIDFSENTKKGIYRLDKITYYIGLSRYVKTFSGMGMDVQWGVGVDCETNPDASIEETEDGQVSFEISALNDTEPNVEQVSMEAALFEAGGQVAKLSSRASAGQNTLVVMLDPGHDAKHVGARGNGLYEEELTLKIAQYCKAELERYAGVVVYMTRNGTGCPQPDDVSSGVDNARRVEYAKQVGADVYVSIHLNSAGSGEARGVEVYYPNGNYNPAVGEEGKGVAQSILNNITALGLNNRGVKIRNSDDDSRYEDGSLTDYYGVIRNSKLKGIPGIIVEHAFVSSASDASFLSSEANLKALGVADATGIARYYNLTFGNFEGVFDADYYARKYPDLAVYNGNKSALLQHYLTYGLSEGRQGSPVFDITYYSTQNLDLRKKYGTDWQQYCQHFINYGMNEGRQGRADFNVFSYKNRYKDLRNAYGTNLKQYYLHFVNYGYAEGRKGTGNETKIVDAVTKYKGIDYSAVYDCTYYVNKNSDIKNAYGFNDEEVLAHFVEYGMSEGRQACATFNVRSYQNQYPDLRDAYGNNLKSYYMHYVNYGRREGRSGIGYENKRNATTTYQGVDYSTIYNYDYYVNTHADVKQAFGSDDKAVLRHFVEYGMSEGRQACATFNVKSYQNQYADLRDAYGNNLKSYYMHYINYGRREGRSGIGYENKRNATTTYQGVDYSTIYNYDYYVNTHADVKQAFGSDDKAVLRHFVEYGMSEGRQACATFNVKSYQNQYADLRDAYGNNLKSYYMHYINYGRREGRSGIGYENKRNATTTYQGVDYSTIYNYDYYVNTNADVKQAFGSDDKAVLRHFVEYGMSEGRQACPEFNVTGYRNRYQDLQNAYGNDLRQYYMHYINYGKTEGRTGR